MAEYSLGTATLGTEVDLDPIDKGIDAAEKKAKSGFGKIGDVLKGAFTVGIAGAAVGLTALFGVVASGVGDAREAAQLLGQTNAVIASTGGAAEKSAEQITDLATALSASAGKSLFGDSDVQAAENLLLTFTNLKGAVFDSATAISVDMAQALGGAPKDQAIALGKALNDPIAGVTALSRVGVTFTEQQKEQIKAMQEAGDMAGAQTIILNELNKEFGGSAQAAADADGGWAQFNDRMGEIKESIGAAVLPILNEFIGFLNDPVIPILEEEIPKAIAVVTDILNGSLTDSLGENAAFFDETFTTVSEIVSDASTLIMAILAALAGFIEAHGEEINLILSGAWQEVKGVITVVLALIQGIIKTALALIKGDWQGAWDAIVQMSETVVKGLGQIIEGGLNIILGLFGTSLGEIVSLWTDKWNAIQSAASTAIQPIVGWINSISAAISGVIGWIGDMIAKLQEAEDAIPGWLKGHSPPPLADWLDYIAESAAGVSAQFANNLNMPNMTTPTLGSAALAGGAGGMSIANAINVNVREAALRDFIEVTVDNKVRKAEGRQKVG